MLDRLDASIKEAMLAGNKLRAEVLRTFRGTIKLTAKEEGKEEAEVFLPVLRKQIKQRGDSAEAFNKAGSAEQEAKEKKEAEILAEFLPEQLSQEALTELVQAEVKDSGLELEQKNFGQLIGRISSKVGDQASKGDIVTTLKKLIELN